MLAQYSANNFNQLKVLDCLLNSIYHWKTEPIQIISAHTKTEWLASPMEQMFHIGAPNRHLGSEIEK